MDIIPKATSQITINECQDSCHACKTPLLKLPEGSRINQIASLGAKLVQIRISGGESRTRLEKETIAEIVSLGGSVSQDGFVKNKS